MWKKHFRKEEVGAGKGEIKKPLREEGQVSCV